MAGFMALFPALTSANFISTSRPPSINPTLALLAAIPQRKMQPSPAQAVEVVETVLGGMKDLQGNQVYLSYQPGALFYDAQAKYNMTSKAWGLDINSFGGEYVASFLELKHLDNLPTLDNVTYDTLKEWVRQGWQTYEDSIYTTWPDLTRFKEAGGKVLHYHGEQDGSIPTASSVHYYESVRKTIYPNLSYNASNDALGEWYRLFLVLVPLTV